MATSTRGRKRAYHEEDKQKFLHVEKVLQTCIEAFEHHLSVHAANKEMIEKLRAELIADKETITRLMRERAEGKATIETLQENIKTLQKQLVETEERQVARNLSGQVEMHRMVIAKLIKELNAAADYIAELEKQKKVDGDTIAALEQALEATPPRNTYTTLPPLTEEEKTALDVKVDAHVVGWSRQSAEYRQSAEKEIWSLLDGSWKGLS